MQKETEDNIVVLKRDNKKDAPHSGRGKILSLDPSILFQHARLVDIETGKVRSVDILVTGNVIAKISACGRMRDLPKFCEKIEVYGAYAVPLFVNGFADPVKAFEQTYHCKCWDKKMVEPYFHAKNFTSGCGVVSSLLTDAVQFTLEDIAGKTEKELSQISDMVAKKKEFLFIKAGQDLEELGSVEKKYHKPLSQVLEDFGFLDRQCIIVGGNCFEKDDWQLFAEYDCSVVVCPTEDAKMGRRPVNIAMLRNLGIDVSIGSGYAMEIDFFAYMRQILTLQRCLFEDANVLSERDVLRMAITGLGTLIADDFPEDEDADDVDEDLMEEISDAWKILDFAKIQKGNLANFMIVRAGPELYPDIFKTLVWGKSKQDVMFTVCCGRILQVDGVAEYFESWNQQQAFAKELEKNMRRNKNDN